MLIRQRHPSGRAVPRLSLLAIAVVGALVAFAYPPTHRGSTSTTTAFECDGPAGDESGWQGVDRRPHRLADGQLVVLEQCRKWRDWRRWDQRVRATIFRGARKIGEQTLFRGVTTRDGVAIRFPSTGSPIAIRYDCGDLSVESPGHHTCVRQWRWSEHQGGLIVTSPLR